MDIKIYIDLDGVTFNTIKCIVSLYNDDFTHYKNYEPVQWASVESWNFKELKCASKKYIKQYFNQPRFFKTVEFMDDFTQTVLHCLGELGYPIVFVSLGQEPNLILKEQWLKKNVSFAEFIGVDSDKYKDKSHIDMTGGIYFDDRKDNLEKSNANIKILFGDDYEWNKGWKGERAYNWYEIGQYFKIFD